MMFKNSVTEKSNFLYAIDFFMLTQYNHCIHSNAKLHCVKEKEYFNEINYATYLCPDVY